jgi:hypothetical protein
MHTIFCAGMVSSAADRLFPLLTQPPKRRAAAKNITTVFLPMRQKYKKNKNKFYKLVAMIFFMRDIENMKILFIFALSKPFGV